MRRPVITHDIKELPKNQDFRPFSTGIWSVFRYYTFSVLDLNTTEIPLQFPWSFSIFVNHSPGSEPPICAAIGNPSHLCASFVPVSSLSIVLSLSLLSDALLPIWKLVNSPYHTAPSCGPSLCQMHPAQPDRSRRLLRRRWTGLFYNHLLLV